MANTIQITFNDNVVSGNCVTLTMVDMDTGLQPVTKSVTFQNTSRVASGQIQIPPFTGDSRQQTDYADGVLAAELFVYYFNIDHNGSGRFTFERVANVVTITHNVLIRGFDSADFCGYNATVLINNEVYVPPLAVTDASFSSATDTCNFIALTLTCTEVPDRFYINGTWDENDALSNPIVVNIPRNITSHVIIENSDGDSIRYPLLEQTYSYLKPISIDSSCLSVSVTPSINGATVVVNTVGLFLPTPVLEYSLDGITFQSSNIFTGQINGDYTMYIRDQFGCTGTIDYTVDSAGTRDAFLFISNANSIGFSEVASWDNCSVLKSEENTLNHQRITALNYCENILFNNCDTTTIQFKSNYPTIEVLLRSEDSTETVLTLSKKTENLNKLQNMDCMIYAYNSYQTGIYFTSGNLYDENDLATGESYTLNGNLPEMAIIGNYINLGSYGVHQISDIVYDSTLNVKAIIINLVYTDASQSWIVKSIFDLLPFEVYEFEIPWATYGNGLYDVLITNTNSDETIQHLSENIEIADSHPETIAIRYYNDNNRDIFYKYGIEHLIRVPILDFRAGVKDENVINITDLTTEIVSSSVNETNVIEFDDISVPLFRKLAIALSCRYVFINNVGYAKDSALEYENITRTNMIKVIATMIKTNINYNINRQGQTGVDVGDLDFNIPAFITDGENFIKK